MIPPGSFVKAKLMTGLQTPEGKVYPTLLVLDYAFQSPNNSRINLTGCFALAKTQASLSTERIEFQVYKLSCVGKRGEMFERDMNGFVVDDRDNSFALKGEVQSHQGRVAAMAFMNSVIQGAGEIIQRKGQNIGGANPDNKGTDIILQQSTQTAASKVVDWYLNQATSTLVPTISVRSGQDVWVVVNETVEVPNHYFVPQQTERKVRNDTPDMLSHIIK
jgi:hypothetical protein